MCKDSSRGPSGEPSDSQTDSGIAVMAHKVFSTSPRDRTRSLLDTHEAVSFGKSCNFSSAFWAKTESISQQWLKSLLQFLWIIGFLWANVSLRFQGFRQQSGVADCGVASCQRKGEGRGQKGREAGLNFAERAQVGLALLCARICVCVFVCVLAKATLASTWLHKRTTFDSCTIPPPPPTTSNIIMSGDLCVFTKNSWSHLIGESGDCVSGEKNCHAFKTEKKKKMKWKPKSIINKKWQNMFFMLTVASNWRGKKRNHRTATWNSFLLASTPRLHG